MKLKPRIMEVDAVLRDLPPSVAMRWCAGTLCACNGCVYPNGPLRKGSGFRKEDWLAWKEWKLNGAPAVSPPQQTPQDKP